MELVKVGGAPVRIRSRWPNTFILPKELREAIPDYGARALVFDEVSGAPDPRPFETGPRARVQFVVHETGALSGRYPVYLDVDSATLRSVGQFFINLADQAEAQTT